MCWNGMNGRKMMAKKDKRIARVFPTQTNLCPDDPDVFFDTPDLFTPPGMYDEVRVSATFTWDVEKAKEMAHQWEMVCGNVKIGGPAFGDPGGEFEPGMYLRNGVTITSRGCVCDCPWCFVPAREGKLRELTVRPGHIVQDNNLLACSRQHIRKVFLMLKAQKKAAQFQGGLDVRFFRDWHYDLLLSIRVRHIWLAYDHPDAEKEFEPVVKMLRERWPRYKVRAYVLIGYHGDTIDDALHRLFRVWDLGALPFSMLYCNEKGPLMRGDDWARLQHLFARDANTKRICKERESLALRIPSIKERFKIGIYD